MTCLRHALTWPDLCAAALSVVTLAAIIIVGVLQLVTALLRGATTWAASGLSPEFLESLRHPTTRARLTAAWVTRLPWALLVVWAFDALFSQGARATSFATAVDINLIGFGCAIALGFEPPEMKSLAICRRGRRRG